MTVPRILVDSWAWIEMIRGSGEGARVRQVIQSNPDLVVSVLILYELRYRIEQLLDAKSALHVIDQITKQAEVIPVDDRVAILGGTIKLSQREKKIKMGAVDCMILATARIHGLKILSGDRHFTGLEENLN